MKTLLLALLVPLPVFGSSLDEWLQIALQRNPELHATRQKWEAARQKAPQAKGLPDPMLGVDFQRMGTTRFDTYDVAEFMVSQPLPGFGKRGAKATVAKLEAEVIGFQYLELARSLRAQVIAAYWDLWLAQRTAALAAENRQLLEQFVRVAKARYEAGQATQADVLRAEMELAKLANEVTAAEREIEVAQAAVNKLLAADPATARVVSHAPALPALESSLDQLQAQARQYCCILMSLWRAVQARQAAVRVARLENAPDFELRVAARQFNGRSGIQEYDTGLAMSFPWLWRGKYRAMQNEAKAELEMAQADFDNELNNTMLELKELYTQTESALRLVAVFENQVLPQAKQLVETTRAGYEAGAATFLELIEAQKLWRDAQLDHERARAAAGKARAKLDAIAAPWGEFEFATGLVTRDMK